MNHKLDRWMTQTNPQLEVLYAKISDHTDRRKYNYRREFRCDRPRKYLTDAVINLSLTSLTTKCRIK